MSILAEALAWLAVLAVASTTICLALHTEAKNKTRGLPWSMPLAPHEVGRVTTTAILLSGWTETALMPTESWAVEALLLPLGAWFWGDIVEYFANRQLDRWRREHGSGNVPEVRRSEPWWLAAARAHQPRPQLGRLP